MPIDVGAQRTLCRSGESAWPDTGKLYRQDDMQTMGAAKKLLDKKVLKELVPLNALSAVHLDEISRKAIIETVRSGRYVFRAGDRDCQSVYLLDGKIELIEDNSREVVASIIDGSEGARHPLAHKQPRQLSARAVGSVTVARVDSSLLDVLLTWDETSGYDVVEIDAEDGGDWMTRMLQSQAFLQLPPSNIHQLLMRLESVNAQAGDLVVKQDDDGDYFYIVKSGRIAVSRKTSARSKDVLLAELGEGACFGEEALVSGASRNATVTMLTDGSLMRLSKEDFDELLCTPLVREVDYTQAIKLSAEGAEWLDVRLPGEFGNQYIKGSRNFPLSALREQADTLDGDTRYVICCDTGRRSASGAFILSQRGFDVYTLRNGLMDVPGDVLDGTFDQPQADTPAHDADIIPFENDNAVGDAESGSSRQDSGSTGRLNEQSGTGEAARNEQQVESEALRGRIESLEHALHDAEEKHKSLLQRSEAAQRDRDSTTETSQDVEKQRIQLELELARVREDYQQLGQRTSAVAGERDAASRELEKTRDELEDLKVRLDNQQGEVSEQVSALQKRLDAREVELVAQIEKLGEQARGQEKQLQDSFLAEKTALEKQLQTLQGNIGHYEQQLTEATRKADEAERSTETAQLQLDEQAQEMDALRQARDKAKSEFDELSAQHRENAEKEALLTQRVAELEQQLASRECEYASDLGSAREAMTRAQTEVDNLKREQQRQLDRQRKTEATRDRERSDHEIEVHRLRKEMKSAAGGSSEALAAELEALQVQLSDAASLRDDLEIQLGERGAQMEDADERAALLEQQLKLAQQSAREAEQQLIETNRTANEEMEIRLNTEQGNQQALREALEKSERELGIHQETITVINQELEDLRNAYQQSKQVLEGNEDAVSRLEDVQNQLGIVQMERDELRLSAEAQKRELDQLRAEAEVRRGLEGIVSDEDISAEDVEALKQAKLNVEVAVRLRTQAEEKVESLTGEVEQLRAQLDDIPASTKTDGAIPSLDDNDPYAASPMLPDVPEIDDDDVDVFGAAELLDDDVAGELSASIQPPRSGLMRGLLVGLLIGGAAGAGLFWWQAGSGQASLRGAAETVTLENSPDQTQQRAVDKQETAEIPVPSAANGSRSVRDKAPAVTTAEVNNERGRQPDVAETVSGVAVISKSSRVFPLAKGMPDVPRSAAMKQTGIEDNHVKIDVANALSARQAIEIEAATPTPVADPAPELIVEPVVEQPAGSFRDRFSDGGIGPTMMRFNADHFLMGSSSVSPEFDERPQHDVRLNAFAIGVYETTFDEYDAFARATGRRLPNDNGWGRATWPVINVSWDDARAYARWLSAQTGALYRLPTEAEWEFVARSGTETRYWWGEDIGKERANCFDCGSEDGGVQSSRVGSFSAAPWGVYDTAGNVREWVQDCYVPNYSRAPGDGRAVDVSGCADRVVRGGAYSSPAAQLRGASRDRVEAKIRLDNIGFRVVREY